MNKASLFRKVALDRLSSPEQLDQMMVLTRPRNWAALAALGAILLASLAWGIFGRVQFSVTGQGIFVRPSGVMEVVSLASGQVTEILVTREQTLAEGDTVARLGQPELESELAKARQQIADLEDEQGQTADLARRGRAISDDLLTASDDFLHKKMAELEEQKAFLEEQYETQKKLVERGLVTKSTLNDAQQQIFQVTADIATTEQSLEQNRLQRIDNRRQAESDRFDREQKIKDLQQQVTDLEKRLASSAQITSPFAGKVTDLLVDLGDMVGTGTAVVSLEQEEGALEVVLYVPPKDGKRVLPGMTIQVTPSTVKREEFGFIRGTVRSVSDFPSQPASMMAFLHDQSLVSSLSSDGPPIEVRVQLQLDDTTPTGFAWSSAEGPPGRITSGTLVDGSIVVREEAPIRLVVPKLKKILGL